ncbi:HlyD family secretion protein [Sphingobacterium lactis]|uniref:HlyD family secretion protein n=3 Tax=Sphingobacterium lactis TaxID=797291 RepID=UPI003DA42B72
MKKISAIIAATIILSACGEQENKAKGQQETIDRSAADIKEIVGVGKVEPESKIVNLAATSGGIVNHIFKMDGDSVAEGEKLVQLENETEVLKTSEIKSQINTQRSQIALEKNNIKDAEWKLNNKRKLLATTKNLVSKGAETGQVYDDLETEVKTLEVALEKSKVNMQMAKSKLQEIVGQLRTSEAEAGKKVLRAPTAGKVLNMQVTQGAALNQYATYAEFAPAGALIVRTEVDELFSQKLKMGQQVDIRYAGSQEVIAKGEIIMLSPYLKKKALFSEKANDQEDRRVREVRISIKGNPGLVINSKVECVIKL